MFGEQTFAQLRTGVEKTKNRACVVVATVRLWTRRVGVRGKRIDVDRYQASPRKSIPWTFKAVDTPPSHPILSHPYFQCRELLLLLLFFFFFISRGVSHLTRPDEAFDRGNKPTVSSLSRFTALWNSPPAASRSIVGDQVNYWTCSFSAWLPSVGLLPWSHNAPSISRGPRTQKMSGLRWWDHEAIRAFVGLV